MNLRVEPGFLGTDATMLADITLLAYLLLLVPAMLVGFIFARRKMFEPYHKYTMTAITIFNWILILFVMAVSYSRSVAPNVPENLDDRFYGLPTLHLVTGAMAQILATYLVIRMWFEKSLPQWFMVKRIKRYMRTTLALWLVTAALGVMIYITWYTGSSSADVGDTPIPSSTEEPSPEATEAVTPATSDEVQEPPATEESLESDDDADSDDSDNDDNDVDDDDSEPSPETTEEGS